MNFIKVVSTRKAGLQSRDLYLSSVLWALFETFDSNQVMATFREGLLFQTIISGQVYNGTDDANGKDLWPKAWNPSPHSVPLLYSLLSNFRPPSELEIPPLSFPLRPASSGTTSSGSLEISFFTDMFSVLLKTKQLPFPKKFFHLTPWRYLIAFQYTFLLLPTF